MDRANERLMEIESTVADIRRIEAEGGVTRASLERIKQHPAIDSHLIGVLLALLLFLGKRSCSNRSP